MTCARPATVLSASAEGKTEPLKIYQHAMRMAALFTLRYKPVAAGLQVRRADVAMFLAPAGAPPQAGAPGFGVQGAAENAAFGPRAEPEQVGPGTQTKKTTSEARAVSRLVTTAPYPALVCCPLA